MAGTRGNFFKGGGLPQRLGGHRGSWQGAIKDKRRKMLFRQDHRIDRIKREDLGFNITAGLAIDVKYM